MSRFILRGSDLAVFALWLLSPGAASCQAAGACQRFPAGSSVSAPADLFSANGVLTVDLTYRTGVDANGNTLYCFVADDGAESPTLHVSPGDERRKGRAPVI